MTKTHYKAFISYSHDDVVEARWLQDRLESWRPPRSLSVDAVPRPVFRDRDGFAAASSLTDAIREALSASDFLVVLCSRASARSHWVDQEIRAFRELGRADRVLGLVVETDAAVPVDACLPAALRDAPGGEPLLADLRAVGDGRRLALAKIVARLVDVDLGALLQREAQRRNRRLALLATGSLAATLVMAALTTFALLSREAAIESRQEADARRAQAEDLIGFMLGDLRAKLETVGRLDVLADVGDRAAAYFASVPADDLTEEELHQRARSIRQFGVDRLDEGDLDTALARFEEARALDRELLTRTPADKDRALALALSHYWVGVVHFQRDALDAARAAFEAQRDVLADLAARHGDDPEIRTNLAYVRNNVGMLQRQRGDLAAALESLSQARAVLLELAEGSEDIETLRSAVDASVTVGELQYRVSALGRARTTLEEGLAIAERMVALDAANVLAARTRDQLRGYLAQVLDATGDDAALGHLDARIDGARQRLARSERDTGHARDLARSLVLRARMLVDRDRSAALAAAEEAVAVLEPLLALDGSNRRLARELGDARLARAAALAVSDASAARPVVQEVHDSVLPGAEGEYEDRLLRWRAAALLARLLEQTGEEAGALALRARALEELAAAGDRPDAELVRVHARLLADSGRRREGAVRMETLSERGWSVERPGG